MGVMQLLHAARLSQKATGQTGFEMQDQDALIWADTNGHEIIHTAADHQSGTIAPWNRRNLKAWVTDPGKIALYGGIVAAKPDRLSRAGWLDETEIRRWAMEHGKELFIVSPSLHWPPRDMAEQLSWEIDAAQAHEEWVNTSKRYRRMQAHLRENGYLVNKPAFGYRVSCEHCGESKCQCGPRCPHHKTMAPTDTGRRYIPQMFGRYLAGDSLTAICQWLDSEDVRAPGGGTWYQKSIGQILRNPVYSGRQVNAKGQTILKVEPVVSSTVARQVIAKLDTAPRKRGAVSGDTAMLTGIIRCAAVLTEATVTGDRKPGEVCNGPMYRKWVPGGKDADGNRLKVAYYYCNGTARNPSKCKNMIRLDEADERASSLIMNLFGSQELVEQTVIPGHDHQDEIEAVERDIRELDLDDPEFPGKQAALLAERNRLKALPFAPETPVDRPMGITVGQHWASLDAQERREWLTAGNVKILASKDDFQLEGSLRRWQVGQAFFGSRP